MRAIVRAAGSPQSGTEHRVRLSQRGDGRAVRTYQARLGVVDDAPLRAYAAVFGRALRSLHASRHSGNVRPKPDFMRAFGLTSRQYNAVKFSLDGMESSIVELRPGRIADLRHRIKAADKKLAKLHDATPPMREPRRTNGTLGCVGTERRVAKRVIVGTEPAHLEDAAWGRSNEQ